MFRLFQTLTLAALAITLGTGSALATVAIQVYTFTGDCTDCTGTGTAELILLDSYVLGTPLSDQDLFSFNYTSNLIPVLSIHNDPSEMLSGILPVGLGPADISISGMNGTFNSNLDGSWSAFTPPDDIGTNGIWTSPSGTPIPEPSVLPVIAICLLSVILFRARPLRLHD